jgi:hypothetical protein
MNPPEFSVARTTQTAIEADLLISALRSEGYHPLDLLTAGHISVGGADISYHIQVPTDELAQVGAFLKAYDESLPAASVGG